MKESINLIFQKTVEKELDNRFLEFEKNITTDLVDVNLHIDSFNISAEYIRDKSIISHQFAMIQQLMMNYNIPFSITQVDSIFHSFLSLNKFSFIYQLNLMDSSGRCIKTAGQPISNGFKTIVLPIVNGEKIQAIVKITMPDVFRNMLVILCVSILIFFFIVACLIYEIKILLSQYHINQLRKNFTHALTHDMKTPLATIHSVLSQLGNGTIDEHPDMKNKFIAIAVEQIHSLQAIVNQILTLAYIEKEQLTLTKQSIDLQSIIQSLIDKFTTQEFKTIEFQSSYNLGDSVVYADSFYLNNAVSNLIDNAIKYSGTSVKIGIECTVVEKQVCIRVKDNGFGISSKDQRKIFNRFERGAEIKRNQISGFGIGLNYVQQVITAHGGKITLLSEEGIGSEFIITLPTST